MVHSEAVLVSRVQKDTRWSKWETMSKRYLKGCDRSSTTTAGCPCMEHISEQSSRKHTPPSGSFRSDTLHQRTQLICATFYVLRNSTSLREVEKDQKCHGNTGNSGHKNANRTLAESPGLDG